MDIEIFGFKFRVEILILIVLAYWIVWGHVICSCSKVSMKEGIEIMKGGFPGFIDMLSIREYTE